MKTGQFEWTFSSIIFFFAQLSLQTKEKKEREDQDVTIEKLRSQVKSMESTQAETISLSKRIQELELENARLRQELEQTSLEKNALNDEMGRVLQEHKEVSVWRSFHCVVFVCVLRPFHTTAMHQGSLA